MNFARHIPQRQPQPQRPTSDGCGKKDLDAWLGKPENNPKLDKPSVPHAGPKISELPAACRQVLLAQ